MAINPSDNNAQVEAGPAVNVADTANEVLIRGRLVGDTADRLQITCAGVIKTGAGSVDPTPIITTNSASAAFTQTYSTAARTVTTASVAGVLTTAAGLTSYGFTQAQADSIPVAINALAADVLVLRQVLNAVIDTLQAAGLA